MRIKALLACLCLVLLSGCGGLPKSKDWTHPQVANPRKEDKLFAEDTKFCEDKVGTQVQGQARDTAMADCYRRLGWKPKD